MDAFTEEQAAKLVAMAMDLARSGDTAALVEFFERGMSIDVQDADGNTALMLAAYNGHADTVRALLDHGADVDLRNARDQAPIAGALFKGEDEVVALLRKAGADLDAGTPSARATAQMFDRAALLE